MANWVRYSYNVNTYPNGSYTPVLGEMGRSPDGDDDDADDVADAGCVTCTRGGWIGGLTLPML